MRRHVQCLIEYPARNTPKKWYSLRIAASVSMYPPSGHILWLHFPTSFETRSWHVTSWDKIFRASMQFSCPSPPSYLRNCETERWISLWPGIWKRADELRWTKSINEKETMVILSSCSLMLPLLIQKLVTSIRVLPRHESKLYLNSEHLLTVQLTGKKQLLQAGKLVTYVMKLQNIC